jgi:hypothetical protein
MWQIHKAVLFQAESECDPLKRIEVTVKDGTLRGTSMTSEKGRPFCVFLGIPYAQPPVGHLRFKVRRNSVLQQ